jgi:uncharacterized protein (DUF427 family)
MDGRGEVRIEQSKKWLRGYIGGQLIFDTKRPLMVWEKPYYPTYYVPESDVAAGLVANGEMKETRGIGEGESLDIKANGLARERAAIRFPSTDIDELREQVRFRWDAIDEWLEEDEPVYTHPRDPYTRIDILNSSRHVEVVVDGVKVAETHKPTILYETGLPPRYYMPVGDVDTELLTPSDKQTHCPYKGTAEYFSLAVGDTVHHDSVWIYRTPLPESQKIAGLVCFFNEKVDLYVDGELQERPQSPFS